MVGRLTSVELFSGAGGLALGVGAAGFRHRLLVEYNKDAVKTLEANRAAFGSSANIHAGDVREVDFSAFRGTDLLAAGAPCQPFSIGGKHRADRDDRNLFPEVFRAVREMRPKAVIVENVKGLLRPALSDFVDYIERQLSNPDVLDVSADPSAWPKQLQKLRASAGEWTADSEHYVVRKVLLNAADFGIPQLRHRVFFVAIRGDVTGAFHKPKPGFSLPALRFAKEVSAEYWRNHAISRRARPGHPFAGKWEREAGHTLPWRTVRDALSGLPEPIAGEQTEGWFNHAGQPGAKSYPGHTGSPLDLPAKTLKAGVHGVPGGENMLRRPNGTVRYFTVREAARLQTFPDSYLFTGAWGETMRQIGNAVPVQLAQVVAEAVVAALSEPSARLPKSSERSIPLVVQGDLLELPASA
jgi:DNA (cytosine-5)-methyltransferase 1